MTGRPLPFEHERYEELCALATAGALTAAESEDLFAHLDKCIECSKHFEEYQSLAGEAMPRLVGLHRTSPEADQFDENTGLDRLLQSAKEVQTKKPVPVRSFSRYVSRPVWQGLAAASLLCVVAIGSYKFGAARQPKIVERALPVFSQPAGGGDEVQALRSTLQDEKRREEELRILAGQRDIDLEEALEDAKAAQARFVSLSASVAFAEADAASRLKAVSDERDASAARLQGVELLAKNAQDELDSLRSQHKQDLAHLASLQGQLSGLTLALNDQSSRAKDDEQYLASDKDIRDLIGARNLYIADIMDVREDGSSRKPFGRVFYTKTKSLIFYAYDLDKQPGVKRASTFQVWGRTGPDDRKPLNLGVLYLDSETNQRWTLRVNNPEQLARLDAVFVTVEQHEQTEKPTGKPFLYASLRREPNHP